MSVRSSLVADHLSQSEKLVGTNHTEAEDHVGARSAISFRACYAHAARSLTASAGSAAFEHTWPQR